VDDTSPLSVRSAMELLSAAYAVNPAFAEARIVESCVGLRPALPDQLPRIVYQEGLVRVNGLFRHGYLISPKLVALTCAIFEGQEIETEFAEILEEVPA